MPTVELSDYAPHEGQRAFHADGTKIRLLRGAVRSGKTHALLWELIHAGLRAATRGGPGATFLLSRKTAPALTDTTVKDLLELLPPALIVPNSVRTQEGRQELTLLGGTRVMIRSMDDWRKKGGTSYDAIFLDEAWEYTEIDFEMLLGRLSGKWGPRRMVLATNPPTRSHWLYKRFVSEKTENMAEHVFSTYMNRRHLPPMYIEDLELAWDDARKKRFLHGDWGFTSDRSPVYPDFVETTHTGNLKYRPGGSLVSGWDFGYRHPAVVWLNILPTGHLEYLRELVGQNIDIKAFALLFREQTELHYPGMLKTMVHYVDIAGRQKQDTTGSSSVMELLKLGIRPRYRKLPLMHSIQQLRDLMRMTRHGLPMVRTDRLTCPLLTEAFQGGYGMDEKTDEPYKDGLYEHLADAARYGASPAIITAIAMTTEPNPGDPRRDHMAPPRLRSPRVSI